MAELEKVKKNKKKKGNKLAPEKEGQATTETKKVKKGKKTEVKVAPKAEETPTLAKAKLSGTNKAKPIADTTDKLPPAVQQRKIVCKDTDEVSVMRVELSSIIATTKTIYVDDIHTANPTALQTIYWVIMPQERSVIARVTKEEYEYVLSKSKKQVNHHISVVDCSVIPTLTYGSWKADQIKGELPSSLQIAEQDLAFKKNPTGFHNPPVKIEIYEAQQKAKAEEAVDADVEEEKEDDFDIDFTDEDFDFSGEEQENS